MSRSPGSNSIGERRGLANSSRIAGQLVADDLAEPRVVAEDRLELGDRLAELGQLLLEPCATEAGELAELHVEDELGLLLAELERLAAQRRRGPRPCPPTRGWRR